MSVKALHNSLESRLTGIYDNKSSSTGHFNLDGDNNLSKNVQSSLLLRDIRRIADVWNARLSSRGDMQNNRGDAVTVESMLASANEAGVDLRYDQKTVSSLGQGDFPAVIMLNSGESLIILNCKGKDYHVDRGGKEYWYSGTDLDKEHTGVVFYVSPAPLQRAKEVSMISQNDSRREEINHKSFLKEAFKLTLEDQKSLVSQLLIAAVLSNIFMMAFPLYSMVVYDRVVPHGAYETLWALSIGVVILLTADFILRFVRLKIQDAISLRASHTLQARLYRLLLQSKMQDAPRTSGSLTNAVRDIDQLTGVLPLLFVATVVDLPFFLVVLVLMASLGGWVAIPPLVGFLILVGFHAYSHKKGLAASQEVNQLSGYQSNLMTETVESLESTKVTASEGRLLRRWEQVTDAQGYSGHIAKLWNGFSTQSTLVISQVIAVAVMITGVYGIGTGSVTVGSLMACTLLVGRAIGPAGQMVSLYYRMKHILHILEKLETFMNKAPEEAGDKSVTVAAPSIWRIDVQNADFIYKGEQSVALSGLNFSIQPGEKVGLIGKSGSGKSTFLRLVPRLYETTRGNLLIGGQDVRQYNPRMLREHIGFMRQDATLFDDTLRANITFGLDHVSDSSFERAIILSGVKDFASKHPQGFGYRVGPRGEKLSGGERQAVLLARSLVCEPKILILDEPTASMDSNLENLVIQNLKNNLGNTTLIMATHRAPVLDLTSRVIWFDSGRVIADGNKDSVLGKVNAKAA